MTEQQIFESLGRKQLQLDALLTDYTRLVAVVRSIKSGECSIDRLTVREDGTWSLEAVK